MLFSKLWKASNQKYLESSCSKLFYIPQSSAKQGKRTISIKKSSFCALCTHPKRIEAVSVDSFSLLLLLLRLLLRLLLLLVLLLLLLLLFLSFSEIKLAGSGRSPFLPVLLAESHSHRFSSLASLKGQRMAFLAEADPEVQHLGHPPRRDAALYTRRSCQMPRGEAKEHVDRRRGWGIHESTWT